MYLRLARLRRFAADCRGRPAGAIATLYFDPEDWAIRLLLVGSNDRSGGPSPVLVSPMEIDTLDAGGEEIRFDCEPAGDDRQTVDAYRPLAGEVIARFHTDHGLAPFWNGPEVWGAAGTPRALREAEPDEASAGGGFAPPTLHPHSSLMGRPVFAPDGRLGVISDLLIDLVSWRIRYFIVWLQAPGESGEVLLSPFWVQGPPEEPNVKVPITTEAIVSGPTFQPEELEPLDERILARYFGFLTE